MRKFLLALSLLLPFAAPAAAKPDGLTVFAAASLKESLDAAVAAWRKDGGDPVTVSYAGTQMLAKQIEQGAPADVFVSADAEWMDYAQERDLIAPDTRFVLARNRLVLVAPVFTSSPPPLDLDTERGRQIAFGIGEGRIAVAETGVVPAGRYAKQALDKYGLWPQLEKRLVQSDSVRAALEYVARGEAPLGIVYATDARVETRVRVLGTFPDDAHAPIVYPVAAVAASKRRDQAARFLDFLRGDKAAQIFRDAGFLPAGES